MTGLDRINLQLVELLRRDGRMSLTDLARAVGRSETTVRERLGTLRDQGIIQGFQAVVDPGALGYNVRAWVRAEAGLTDLEALAQRLAAIPEVVSASLTSGSRPLEIQIVTSDMERLGQILERRLLPLGLHRVEISTVLRELVQLRAPPVVRAPGDEVARPLNGKVTPSLVRP